MMERDFLVLAVVVPSVVALKVFSSPQLIGPCMTSRLRAACVTADVSRRRFSLSADFHHRPTSLLAASVIDRRKRRRRVPDDVPY